MPTCGCQATGRHARRILGAMTVSHDDTAASARAEVVGQMITGVFFVRDFIEVHIGHVILTGMTEPFGIIGCHGVGPASMVALIGQTVDDFSVV